MISFIEGKIKIRSARFLVIETNGIGYKVFALPDALKKNAGVAAFWTHLRVREDSMELYGFETYQELEFFELLIQISGVGPKLAMSVLSIASLDSVKKAIASGEVVYLTKVSGIGKKTAERIIIELQDKVGKLDESSSEFFKEEQDVTDALNALGYSASETREALKKIPEDTIGVNARIKAALKVLGK